MTEAIRTVGVIGAGVMGTAIAAHLAGAGLDVHLLDIVEPGVPNRNARAQSAIQRALETKPAPFFVPEFASAITPGNLEDHLERLSECDLVIEAVVERLDIKQALFAKLAPVLQPTAVLASNTSGLSLAQMAESLPSELRRRFLVLHFFNPVRYMRLLEVVPSKYTDEATTRRMAAFGEELGKGVVFGKDTTNFVANRIGVYSMFLMMHEMVSRALDIEVVDAIAGKPMGRPKSAAFNTGDLVGLDTLAHVAKNCLDSLPDDPERDVFRLPDFVQTLIDRGQLGRKTGAGFYKKAGKEILVFDLGAQEYRAQRAVEFASLTALKGARGPEQRLQRLIAGTDRAAEFAWTTLAKTLCYSAGLVGEIADDVVNIDRAMRWGFNWELGPFEAWDAIGVAQSVERMKRDGFIVPAWVDTMLASGRASFYAGTISQPDFYDVAARGVRPVPRHEKNIDLGALKDQGKRVAGNAGASLVDLGDGVACLEVHTKMNTLDADVIAMLGDAGRIAEQDFEALVVGNGGEHFCAGANLMMIAQTAEGGQWQVLDGIIRALQDALQSLRQCRVPVVSAPFQYTLGGGAELAMASDGTQAYAETYMGLVEVGVGLLPAGCGCLRLVERYTASVADVDGVDLLPLVAQASLQIAMAKVSTSADEARKLRYLRPADGVSLNREFLLHEAKQRALGLAGAGYRPPRPLQLAAAGHDAAKTIAVKVWGMVEGGFASPHDALIANKVAGVLCGGAVAGGTLLGEQHYLDLEREAFLSLCGEPLTQQRIKHMLETGKPLRN